MAIAGAPRARRASLSGVWPPNWMTTPSGRSRAQISSTSSAPQRLEVEPVGGVVVGGDGLRVAVDHHRLVAERAERLGGVDAAVVELDPLADPVRARAEDDDRRLPASAGPRPPRPRSSRGSSRPPRPRPRTSRRAGRPVARPTPRRSRRAPPPRLCSTRRPGPASDQPARFQPQPVVGDQVGLVRVEAQGSPWRARARRGTKGARRRGGRRARPRGSALPRRARASASPSGSASVNVRPIPIASPTDFICVPSVSSAPGNFSNAKRGNLTTT